ncbi:MAG: KUP/HAK/KT family potassium transporter [Rhodospirillales bacterium]
MSEETSKAKASLTVAALGIVFGDIGTSPLYSFREAATAAGGEHSALQILGVLSLIVWTITLSVSFKYVGLVLRVNNDGEGGILALSTLLGLHRRSDPRGRFLLVFGLLGAAMLFGDGVITPAISVLSAIEGLEVVAPALSHAVVPLTVLVLFGLFAAQRAGTHRIGALFGPAMMVWFTVLGILGLISVIGNPAILQAFDPRFGIALLTEHPERAALILAAVFLTITGGEALYADLGSFGRPAIARAWFLVAMPGLLLNYFGQGALLLSDPTAIRSPFYLLAPEVLRLPLVILAALATVIASQAVITGVFALARQAMQVDLLVRLRVIHTAEAHESHVYLPAINWFLAVLSIAAVLGFRSSDALADAYGMAVATAMITTTLLFVATLIHRGRLNRLAAWALGALLLAIDLVYFVPNLTKLETGGWLPLSLASIAMVVMFAWRMGIRRTQQAQSRDSEPLGSFALAMQSRPASVPRWAVFLTRGGDVTPAPLANMDRLLETVFDGLVLVSVKVEGRPRVPPEDRLVFHWVGTRVLRVELHVGYMQGTSLPSLIGPLLGEQGLDSNEVVYVVGHERPLPPRRWRRPRDLLLSLFCLLVRNAERRNDRFDLPPRRTLEVGYSIRLDD